MRILLKTLLYFLLAILLLIAGLATTGYVLSLKHQIQPSHDTPYIHEQVVQATRPEADPVWRVLLLGDAGKSTLNPWHPSLVLASELAREQPDTTSVIMLGDNIYTRGYPVREEGQAEFTPDQLALIDRLDAQLQIARHSGAELFVVPGNHDWYAEQVNDQARHVARYAEQYGAEVEFTPWDEGRFPLAEAVHRPGLSLVFLDTQWMLTADESALNIALYHLESLLSDIESEYPDNRILVTAHHPLQTMGPHAGYYTSRRYAASMGLIELFFGMDQDITNPAYRNLIAALNKVLTVDAQLIFAAGHDHSLQVFEGLETGPDYQLVSGAANASKLSGVGHNEQTHFAVSREGFMMLSLYPEGLLLEVFSTPDKAVIHRQWLD